MAATTTQIQIANRALQLLGSQPISAMNENSRGARAVSRAYGPVMLKALRENYWSFAIKRAILAAAVVKPIFGPANYFPVPADFVQLAPRDQFIPSATSYLPSVYPNNIGGARNDWMIENMDSGLAIASNDSGPLYVRYVSSNVLESQFDVAFAEALSAMIAMEICEELTNSNSKLQNAMKIYEDAIRMARKRNAFEQQPVEPPADSYLYMRY